MDSHSQLLALPAEILFHILCRLSHYDLCNFSASCRDARRSTSPSNYLLWQAIFLQKFDDPHDRWGTLSRRSRENVEDAKIVFDWHTELKRRIVALRHMRSGTLALADGDEDAHTKEGMVTTLLDIMDTAKTCLTAEEVTSGKLAKADDRYLSLNLQLLPTTWNFTPEFDGLIRGLPASAVRRNMGLGYYGGDTLGATTMRGGWVNDRVTRRPTTRLQASLEMDKIVRSEAASRLHVLCGLTEYEEKDEKAVGRARRLVYDWNTTDELNEWGPFKRDGSGEVDWRRLEAIMTVVARQFGIAVRGRMILPQGFCFSLPHRTLTDPTVPDDWAGVQGGWCGTYVFLHWEDLVEFNAIADPASRPTLESGPEACGGLMKLELKLDMKLKDDPKLRSKLPVCQDLQTLYFSGMSRSYDFQMATGVRGMACLAPGGREVKWRYIINYSGSDQWQLEGVQPGGIRSGCVYGLWTSCAREDDGAPVGPFIYAPEELCKPTSVVLVSARTTDDDDDA